MANTASKKALRHGGVTVALTVLVVLSIILLNASVTSLAMRYGWFVNMNPTLLYPVTDTCYDYLYIYHSSISSYVTCTVDNAEHGSIYLSRLLW